MASDPEFAVRTLVSWYSDFLPVEQLPRVKRSGSIVVGAIEVVVNGVPYLGTLYNSEIGYVWLGMIEACRALYEDGASVEVPYDFAAGVWLQYTGWQRSHIALMIDNRKAVAIPSGQFLRVTLTEGRAALRALSEHFPRMGSVQEGIDDASRILERLER
jgi:hypothetical protein